MPHWWPRLARAGRTLAEILTNDSTRPLALFLALKLLALGALLGATTGAQAALVVFGLPVAAWGAVFAIVGGAVGVSLLGRSRRLQHLTTLAALVCWALLLAASAVRTPVGTFVYYVPDFVALALVLWRVRPNGSR